MRISPNADPNESFFIDVSMADQQRDEYVHIEQCIYTERDDYGFQLGDSIMLIEDGCDLSGGLIKFKGIFRSINCINPYTSIERTETTQHQEQFFLKPFQIENQIANTFDINCKVSACSKADNFNGYCVPGDACKKRYATLGLESRPVDTTGTEVDETNG